MKTHKLLSLFTIVLVLLVTGFAKEKIVVESKWAAAPIQIDGNPSDWAQEDLVLNKDFDLNYAFKNDVNFLYVVVAFDLKEGAKGRLENRFMSSIDFTGLTLWLNYEGKEKKAHGLHFYRKQVTGDQLIQEMEKQGQTLTDQQKQNIKTKPSYSFFACDAVNNKGKVIARPGTVSGTFRTARVEKKTVFEYVIPLALLQDPASQAKWDPSLPLTVGFEWGGLTEEMKRNLAGRVGDQGAMARAGEAALESQIGGGEGQDFRAPESSLAGQRRSVPKKYDFWVDLKLAAKQ